MLSPQHFNEPPVIAQLCSSPAASRCGFPTWFVSTSSETSDAPMLLPLCGPTDTTSCTTFPDAGFASNWTVNDWGSETVAIPPRMLPPELMVGSSVRFSPVPRPVTVSGKETVIPTGVTEADAADALLFPTLLVATTVNV